MNVRDTFKLTPSGEREIIITRQFDAPRKLVFDSLTRPELVSRWLLGPEGWTVPVCEIDLKVGGSYRYLWRHDTKGTEMGIRGVYREIAPPGRIVHTEKFDEAWYPGEAIITTTLVEHSGRTTLTMTILYDSRETRDNVLKSGMERGVMASYNRLEDILAELVSK